jgi:hypothetical protein
LTAAARTGDKPPAVMNAKSSTKRDKPHRRREEKELRQFIGATVRAASKRRLNAWAIKGKRRSRAYNIGRTIDELVDFGERLKFQPAA